MAESITRTLAPPQAFSEISTGRLTWTITLALIPAALWGIVSYGWKAALVLGVSITAALVSEILLKRISKQGNWKDGSAVLWGLLLGMSLPPTAPIFIPLAGSLFMILVVKGVSGNLGTYWVHPVLASRAFLVLSWPVAMGTWTLPQVFGSPDAIAASTPLSAVKDSILNGSASQGPMAALSSHGIPRSPADSSLTDWLNSQILAPFNITLPGGYSDLFLGNSPGSIGEGSALLILMASVYLLGRGLIRWEIPLFYFGSFSLLTWVFGGLPFSGSLFSGDVLFQVLSGGFLLVLFFIATDPVTTPMTKQARILFALGAGLLTFFLRFSGSSGEGAGAAVLLMSLLVPLLDQGFRKRKNR